MVQYYQTGGGLYYKKYSNGRKVRVSKAEFQNGGAAKKKSPKKTAKKTASRKTSRKTTSRKASSRKTSRKTASRKTSRKGLKSPKKTSGRMNYTPSEQACIDHVQAKIGENVKEMKAGKFKHIAQAVAVSYSQMREAHPECADFYDREKARKDALKAQRRAEKKKAKRSRRKSRRSKKTSKKRSKSRSKSRKRSEASDDLVDVTTEVL